MISLLSKWASFVKFSHTVFALPFALASAWLAAGGLPEGRTLVLIVACAVSARTAAMAFNRWLDRRIDAANPRTVDDLVGHVVGKVLDRLGIPRADAVRWSGELEPPPEPGTEPPGARP